jgi:predicted acyl esterase
MSNLRIDFDARVPLCDGVNLSVHVYRPRGDGPWPAVVLRTPYNKNSADNYTADQW